MKKTIGVFMAGLVLLHLQSCAPRLSGGALNSLPSLKDYTAARESSHDRSGGNADWVDGVRPGDTAVLAELEGPGMITHIWVTIDAEKWHGRTILLKMYWDGEEDPSVLCPINDFFCMGHGLSADLWSIPITTTSHGRARNSFFKMPFNESARIEIVNEGLEPIRKFYYYIDYRKYQRPFQNVGYFHARYRQEYPAVSGRNYLVCSAFGRGHFVGCNLSVESNEPGWWGEGDDRIFIDGEEYPSFHGTGSEDYLSDAWGIWPGSSPYYGTPIHEGANYAEGNRYTSYRFHIEDPIPFTESFRFEIEDKGFKFVDGKNVTGFAERADNWSSVAYWYQVEPHQRWAPIPPADARLPREASREISLLRFLRETEEYTGSEPIEPFRETFDELRNVHALKSYAASMTVGMARAEGVAGNTIVARELLEPYTIPFILRDLADEIFAILPDLGNSLEIADGGRRPLLVDNLDGSVERVEIDGRVCIRTRQDDKKPLIYFDYPEPDHEVAETLRGLPSKVTITVDYYSHGTPGDTFMVEYDSTFSDDIDGYYHDSEIVEKPAEPGWYTARIDCPNPAFLGRQNANADFRISSLGNGDEYIADVVIK
jgi:hypothetical protein